ncbi:MAG: hypothetical protein ACFCUQ_19025 [Kiloniellales bacterium]
MLRTVFFALLGSLILPLLAPVPAGAQDVQTSRLLRPNVQETGIYDFCLSYEDARIERDARVKAITQGLSLQDYREIAPNTRCYRNTISFIPLALEPRLDGVGYLFKADSQGPYRCPGKSGKRCTLSTGILNYIKAELLYGKIRFPVYVALTNAQLAGR